MSIMCLFPAVLIKDVFIKIVLASETIDPFEVFLFENLVIECKNSQVEVLTCSHVC